MVAHQLAPISEPSRSSAGAAATVLLELAQPTAVQSCKSDAGAAIQMPIKLAQCLAVQGCSRGQGSLSQGAALVVVCKVHAQACSISRCGDLPAHTKSADVARETTPLQHNG